MDIVHKFGHLYDIRCYLAKASVALERGLNGFCLNPCNSAITDLIQYDNLYIVLHAIPHQYQPDV